MVWTAMVEEPVLIAGVLGVDDGGETVFSATVADRSSGGTPVVGWWRRDQRGG